MDTSPNENSDEDADSQNLSAVKAPTTSVTAAKQVPLLHNRYADEQSSSQLNDEENNALDQFLGESARRFDNDQPDSNSQEGTTGNKEVIMATTLRNLSGTFKEAKAAIATGKIEELSALNDDYDDDFNQDSARVAPSNKDSVNQHPTSSALKQEDEEEEEEGEPEEQAVDIESD